jgi:hypothetical protein
MPVVVIRATIECDGCGRQFRVELDSARKLPADWSLADEATDIVRGGIGFIEYVGESRRGSGGVHMTSVQHDKSLCPKCTQEEDEKDD